MAACFGTSEFWFFGDIISIASLLTVDWVLASGTEGDFCIVNGEALKESVSLRLAEYFFAEEWTLRNDDKGLLQICLSISTSCVNWKIFFYKSEFSSITFSNSCWVLSKLTFNLFISLFISSLHSAIILEDTSRLLANSSSEQEEFIDTLMSIWSNDSHFALVVFGLRCWAPPYFCCLCYNNISLVNVLFRLTQFTFPPLRRLFCELVSPITI